MNYVSTDTSSCDLDAFRGPVDGWLEPWYSAPGIVTSYDWGWISLPPSHYRWRLACHGVRGSAFAQVDVLVVEP